MAHPYAHTRNAAPMRITAAAVAAGLVLLALVAGALPASAFHGEAGDVIHKEIAAVNGQPVDDPDPETGAQNVVVATGDEVTYRIRVSAGEEAGLSEVRIEDVYKPPQQEFLRASDLEGVEIDCGLDIGTEDNTVGCDITLTEEGEGGVLLTFEVIQEAPPGEGCPQITNVATVTLAEEVEPRASNEARIEVCSAAPDAGQITVIKEVELLPGDPDSAFPLADVGFTLFDAECDAAVAGEAFTDDAGVVVFADIELGPYCLVETSPLDGFREIEPIPVELTSDESSVELEVFNEFAFNMALLKLDCTGIDEAMLLVFDATSEEPDFDPGTCEPGEATFAMSGTGFDEPITVEVIEFELIDLVPGAYEIREAAPSQVGPVSFEIGEGELLVAVALNPLATAPAPTSSPPPMLPDTAAPAQPDAPPTSGGAWILAAVLAFLLGALVREGTRVQH